MCVYCKGKFVCSGLPITLHHVAVSYKKAASRVFLIAEFTPTSCARCAREEVWLIAINSYFPPSTMEEITY